MTKKLTKKDYYAQLLAIKEVAENKDLVAFIDHEVDLLNRKNTGEHKKSANQVANDGLKLVILEEMKDNSFTVTEMLKHLPSCEDLSNQKVSALVNQMAKEGLMIREEVKGKAYFKVVK